MTSQKTAAKETRGLQASVPFFPLPYPLPSTFLLSPLFSRSECEKLLSHSNFVRFVRERFLRRLYNMYFTVMNNNSKQPRPEYNSTKCEVSSRYFVVGGQIAGCQHILTGLIS